MTVYKDREVGRDITFEAFYPLRPTPNIALFDDMQKKIFRVH